MYISILSDFVKIIWFGAFTSQSFWRKTRVHLYGKLTAVAADGMALQGGRVAVGILLAHYTPNIS